MCDFFIHRWFWFNGLCFWLLHHSLRGYQPCHFVLHNPPQTGERKCVSCHRDNLMTYRSGENNFKKKKSRHASSSFLQAFYRFHQEKKQKDPALREEKKLKLLKNGRNLFAFESIWFIWKRGIHGFESNTECFELALGDNSGRMSTSEEVRQNPSLWSIFKKVKHSELKR